jgi:very-short-patch-repair endonuclease
VQHLIVATEALAAGILTRRDLARRYTKIYRNVYVLADVELTALDRACAAWLWSGRRATLVGHSAAALLGSKWLPPDGPVEIAHARRPAAPGITVRSDLFRDDELCIVDGLSCTTPARTAYDFGRRLRPETGVIRMDALLNATGVTTADVDSVAQRYPGARGIRRLRSTLSLVDPGAESPQETRLRLLLVRSALPPVTQIKVGRRRIDMGYPEWKVGVEYDGEQHWTGPDDYADDIERLEFLASRGWIIVRVSSIQLRYQQAAIVERVRNALTRAGSPL